MKNFWLRSLGATAIGELIFTAIAYFTEFFGVVPFMTLLKLMSISYAIKVIMNPILVISSMILATALKRSEKIDVYDLGADFNSFKISENEKKKIPHIVLT